LPWRSLMERWLSALDSLVGRVPRGLALSGSHSEVSHVNEDSAHDERRLFRLGHIAGKWSAVRWEIMSVVPAPIGHTATTANWLFWGAAAPP